MNKKQKRARQRDQAHKAIELRERHRIALEEQAWQKAWTDLIVEQYAWLERREHGFYKLWADLQWEQVNWCKAHELRKADMPTHEAAGSW